MKNVFFNNFKKYSKYIRPYFKYQIIIFLLTLFSSIVALANPVLLSVIVDRVLIQREIYLLTYIIIILLFFYVIGTVISYLNGFFSNLIGQKVSLALRKDLFEHIQRLKIKSVLDSDVGDFIAKVAEDVNTISNFLSNIFVSTLSNMLNLCATLVLMVYFSWKLSLIAVIITVAQLYVSVKFSKKTRVMQKHVREKSSEHISFLKRQFSNLGITKAFCKENENVITYHKLLRSILTLNFKNFYLYFEYSTIMSFVSFLGSVLIFATGAYEVFNGHLSVGVIFVFDSVSESFYMFASNLVNLNISLQSIYVAFERLESIFKLEKEAGYSNKLLPSGDEIKFKDVLFKYEGHSDKLVLNKLTLDFKPGETYVIVGKSGEGKSTLINVLLNFYGVESGQVFMGENKLQDVRLRALRQKISVVFQQGELVKNTIIDNIRYGCESASIEEVINAAKISCIHSFIDSLPEKYNTDIGQIGEKLSGGQKQRICIARGILKKADVYVFDEALSNLDKTSEAEIFENLQLALLGKTQIYITHNIDLIKKARNIIVISKGTVEAIGTHNELLNKSLVYQELYKKGMNEFEEKECS